MQNYLNLMSGILTYGDAQEDRTGTGTVSLFGKSLRFDLRAGFPLVTTKAVSFKNICHELLWILKGSGNIQYLLDNNVHIWDEWADKDGNLGYTYGVMWRHWKTYGFSGEQDQIANVIKSLKSEPFGRRHIVTAWNPDEVDPACVALPPCHIMFQFYVNSKRELSCQVYQRSADMFLGVPYNIASYALLTHMIAAQTGMTVGDLIWVGGNCHVYNNHQAQVLEQISRTPHTPPVLSLKQVADIDSYTIDDIHLDFYSPEPAIKGEVSV